MCGIAGYFNTDGEPASAVVLKRMTDAVAYRGPDGEGFYTSGFVALGHRRLAIIDLSPLGHQPMVTPDGRYVLTYNGEIYNFQELRLELEAKGHTFRSRTDSEVVLHAYAEWGPRCLQRFNGMFALAIWDKERLELFLARDRYGIKPLYYSYTGKTLVFASEAKAILAHTRVSRALDEEALVEYFAFQNFFTDRTLLKSIRILPAGTSMVIPLGAEACPKPVTYWDFDFCADPSLRDNAECVEELDRLLKQAVARQLVSDVDVGAYLSGGMDSGTLTAIAATQLPYIRTFTCGFDLHSASGMELAFDEREKAETMSYRFKTEHYEMVLKAGDMERVLPRLARHIEEPRVGQSYPNFYAAQLASKFVKVVLSGAGGDEIFAGYPWRYYRAVQSVGFEDYIERYYEYWQRLMTAEEATRVFSPIWPRVKHVSTRNIFSNVFCSHHRDQAVMDAEDSVQRSLYLEAKTFLHGLLVVEDKLSMAHSLETRVPFLDNDLVDFAMRVPVRLKLSQLDHAVRANENDIARLKRTRDGKMVLRDVMRRHVPADIADGEKQGFSGPDGSWFRGESVAYVRRELLEGNPRIYGYLDRKAVGELLEQHLSGRINRRLLIWSLLSFEWWLRTFLA